jgi:hypothetical protein
MDEAIGAGAQPDGRGVEPVASTSWSFERFMAGLGVAVMVLALPMFAFVGVMASDGCGGEEDTAFICSVTGQTTVAWLGMGGVFWFVVCFLASLFAPRGSSYRRTWTYWCLGLDVLTIMVIFALASGTS